MYRNVRLLAVVAALTLGLALATSAVAAPTEPAIGLTTLRAELAAAPGGVLPGYFKTVLRGSAIERIPVDVLAVTGGPTDDLDPDAALVLFEAKGPVIDRLGGIAAGMSGSPVYVNIRGTDLLLGALAYGETFTKGGSGLATPIEAMSAVEALPASAMLPLSAPVMTSAGMRDRVVIGGSAAESALSAATGGVAVQPLASLYIGGISPKSAPYKTFAAKAEKAGLNVVPLAAELGTGSERFTTPFVPGAAVAALASRGDLWVGGIGTVTYVNGANLMAFGHPLTGEGPTSLYLHNAWVDGMWPSIAFPHKLGTPGSLRGTITQDRAAGILGVTPNAPAEVVVTSVAKRSETGVSDTSRVALTSYIANSPSPLWQGIVPFAATVAPVSVYSAPVAAGSALTTTTVVVTNGAETFVVMRANAHDDAFSVPNACASDVAFITGSIAAFAATGAEPARIVSVEMTSSISAARNAARVVDVSVPGGLKIGDNTVRVGLRQTGMAATRTVEVTLTVPEGTPLDGKLTASGPAMGGQDGGDAPEAAPDPRFLAELVEVLVKTASNDELTVSYVSGEESAQDPFGKGFDAEPITATSRLGLVVSGTVSKQASAIELTVYPASPLTGESAKFWGRVEGGEVGTVEVWARSYGETVERLVATATVYGVNDAGQFTGELPPFASNTRLRAVYSGSSDSLGSEVARTISVRSRVGLTASTLSPRPGAPITLIGTVSPRTFGGSVVFERFDGRTWRRIATVAAPSGRATARFTPPPTGATRVRARTIGSASNAMGTSRTLTVRVR
ncbi:MAG: hypothetical protein U1E26_03275 [Coriobacteriia bacterium]|nr:hypothetical protein [Coriobacteriia bacterium]